MIHPNIFKIQLHDAPGAARRSRPLLDMGPPSGTSAGSALGDPGGQQVVKENKKNKKRGSRWILSGACVAAIVGFEGGRNRPAGLKVNRTLGNCI